MLANLIYSDHIVKKYSNLLFDLPDNMYYI